MNIHNKIYSIEMSECELSITVNLFRIESAFQGRGYSRRVFNSLSRKFGKDIYLECFPTLVDFYEKIGFSATGTATVDGYIEMVKPCSR